MKAILNISAVAGIIVVASTPCFALWQTTPVFEKEAKALGMHVRSEPAGSNHVKVELEFKPQGKLKNFSHVELRIGEGDNPPVTAPLREDRSKPGRVVVGFTADRAQLDKLTLSVMVPFFTGGDEYLLRVKDFVEVKKDR